MFGKIINIREFENNHLSRLRTDICEEIIKYQEKGYYAEVQYSAVDTYRYTALVIIREQVK